MTDEEWVRGETGDRPIEDGETYVHADHGLVEVTGLWQRTRRLETTREADGTELIVVRFVPGENGEWIDELAESLDTFVREID